MAVPEEFLCSHMQRSMGVSLKAMAPHQWAALHSCQSTPPITPWCWRRTRPKSGIKTFPCGLEIPTGTRLPLSSWAMRKMEEMSWKTLVCVCDSGGDPGSWSLSRSLSLLGIGTSMPQTKQELGFKQDNVLMSKTCEKPASSWQSPHGPGLTSFWAGVPYSEKPSSVFPRQSLLTS